MQGKRVHSRRRKSAFPGAPGRSKGRGFIGRFPRFSCGALKRRSFGGPRKRVPSCAGNTSAAEPPRAPPSASDEPLGYFIHPARSSIQKNEQTKAETPASGILRAKARYRFLRSLSALVPLLRNGTNRRVISSARQGHRKQKLSRLMPETERREYFGGRAASCAAFGVGRTAGLLHPPGKVVNTKK